MPPKFLFRSLCFLFLSLPLTNAQPKILDLGLSCADHMMQNKPSNPVLLRTWQYLSRPTQVFVDGQLAYYPRFQSFQFAPVVTSTSATPPPATPAPSVSMQSDMGSAAILPSPEEGSESVKTQFVQVPVQNRQFVPSPKYKDLDMFYANLPRNEPGKWSIRIFFQRPCRVYLFVNTGSFTRNNPKRATFPGWTSEGWAQLQSAQQRTFRFGVHQKNRFTVSMVPYVFSIRSRGFRNVVNLPAVAYLKENVNGITVNGAFHVRFAEIDGTPSTPTDPFQGQPILPNTRCPDALHETWSVFDPSPANGGNPTGTDMFWKTWHPQYDPCYWCAYDHEHGSSAPQLMNYFPTYGLTEFKKGLGTVESNEGFKDFVCQSGFLFWYFSIHVQTSSLRRRDVRLHTVTVTVKNVNTMKTVLHMSVKADFGFIAARKAGVNNRFLPMTPEGDVMFAEQMRKIPFLRAFRSINFINQGGVLDDRLLYVNQPLVGTYEEWLTTLPCSGSPRRGELTVDVEDPITAAKDVGSSERVMLGRQTAAGFRNHVGVRRTLRSRNLVFSQRNCRNLYGADFNLRTLEEPGFFYTDPTGTTILDKNDPRAIRQYIKPGFVGRFTGKYQPVGPNLGLHKTGVKMFLQDINYGISPQIN